MKKPIIRSVSVLLSALIVISCAATGFASGTGKYTGKILMAVNTDYLLSDMSEGWYSFDVSGSTGKKAAGKPGSSADCSGCGDVIDNVVAATPEEYERYIKTHGDEQQAVMSSEYHVGDTKKIYASYTDNDDNSFINIRCIYIGDACTVWTQVLSDGSLYDSEEDAKETAAHFDSVYKAEQAVFGKNTIGTDGDGKFAIISYNINYEAGVAGYVDYGDLVNKFGFIGRVLVGSDIFSNHMDCVYMHGLPANSTLVHEYQHYLFGCNGYYGKTNYNYISGYEPFVNEGFSECAEIIFSENRLSIYGAMRCADEISLTRWVFNSYCYEISGAFCNYLRNRYAVLTNDTSGDFAGKGFYLEYHSRRTRETQIKSTEIFGDILYPADAYPELKTSADRAKQLIIDFWKAVLLREETGIYGFNGEDVIGGFFCEEKLPVYTEILMPGMAKFYEIDSGRTADAVVASSSENIYFEAFESVEGSGTAANGNYTFDYNYENSPEPFTVTVSPGYKLHFPDPYDYDSEIELLPLRPEYNFAGWAESSSAVKPDYQPYEAIDAPDCSVFYAVWNKRPVIEAETSYTTALFSGSYDRLVSFTPAETGYYTVVSDTSGCVYSSEPEPGRLDEVYAGSSHEIVYYLTGGAEYYIRIWSSYGFDPDYEPSFTINKPYRGYSLTFVTDNEAEYVPDPYFGKTEYILPRLYIPYESYLDNQFVGWSLTEGAATPDYDAGDTLTLTEDTVLYAVHRPNPVLTGDCGFDVEYGKSMFTFIPPSDGTYEITTEGDSVFVYDENGKNLGWLPELSGEQNNKGAFAGGHKYYIRALSDVVHFEIRRVSDEINTELVLADYNGNEVYRGSGKPYYTIPDKEPEDDYNGIFTEWEGYYKAGDTVFVLNSRRLFPNYSWVRCEPGNTYGIEDTAFNKADNRRYFNLVVYEKGVYKITAKGGLAYYEQLPDSRDNLLFRNTDEGCFLFTGKSVTVMLDPDVTEFTIEEITDLKTLTFSAEGASGVPAPVRACGFAVIPDVSPEKEGMRFGGWLYTYTFRGEEYSVLYDDPGERFFLPEDSTLTAIFTESSVSSFFERLIEWIVTYIIDPIYAFIQLILSIFKDI